jgi:hypothetical protein
MPGHSGANGESSATLIATDLKGYIPDSESPLNPTGIEPTEDDVCLVWLSQGKRYDDGSQSARSERSGYRLRGDLLRAELAVNAGQTRAAPTGDPRTPDIIVTPNAGVIYTVSTKKQEEHGGFAHDDTNVILLLSNPRLDRKAVTAEVQSAQVFCVRFAWFPFPGCCSR